MSIENSKQINEIKFIQNIEEPNHQSMEEEQLEQKVIKESPPNSSKNSYHVSYSENKESKINNHGVVRNLFKKDDLDNEKDDSFEISEKYPIWKEFDLDCFQSEEDFDYGCSEQNEIEMEEERKILMEPLKGEINQITEEERENLKKLNVKRKYEIISPTSGKSKKYDVIQNEYLEENENMNEGYLKLSDRTPNELLKLITHELSLNKRITISKCKLDLRKHTYYKQIKKGEEFEIIGLDLDMYRYYILVEKTEYEKVMKDKSYENLQNLYKRIKNGWENVTDEEEYNESLSIIDYLDLQKAFEYIKIEENEESKEQKEIEMKCEENNNQNVIIDKKCEICMTNIGKDEYIEKDKYYFHKSCFKFGCCKCCKSKIDLHPSKYSCGFYCGKCFERIDEDAPPCRICKVEETIKMNSEEKEKMKKLVKEVVENFYKTHRIESED